MLSGAIAPLIQNRLTETSCVALRADIPSQPEVDLPTKGGRARPIETGYVLLWTLAAMAILAWLVALLLDTSSRTAVLRQDEAVDIRLAAAQDAIVASVKYRLVQGGNEAMTLPAAGADAFEGTSVRWTATLETDRFDLNRVNEASLAALFVSLGVAADEAISLGDAIADWRDGDDLQRLRGAERPEYEGAGLPGPANRPFRSLGELAGVVGMTTNRAACLSAYLTIFGTAEGGRLGEQQAAPSLARPGDAIRITSVATTEDGAYVRPVTHIYRLTGKPDAPLWLLDISSTAPEPTGTCS